MMYVNDRTAEKHLAEEPYLALLLTARWCSPCGSAAEILDELGKEFPQITFLAVDIDDAVKTVRRFNPTAVPTLYLIREGEVVDMLVGLMSMKTYHKYLSKLVNMP